MELGDSLMFIELIFQEEKDLKKEENKTRWIPISYHVILRLDKLTVTEELGGALRPRGCC